MFEIFNKLKKYEPEKYYEYLTKENILEKLEIIEFNESRYKKQDKTLLNLYGKCDSFDKKIKMIIITDTHGCLNEDNFAKFVKKNKEYDVCLLLGDHSNCDIRIILENIDNEKIYGLLGNHDNDYLSKYKIKNLNGNVIEINGVKLLGIEGSYRYKPEKFPSFSQKESIEFLKDKEKVDILISHDSPYGLSGRKDYAHKGLFGITYYLFKQKIPYCIHGHVHDLYTKELINGTKVESCYMYSYLELN